MWKINDFIFRVRAWFVRLFAGKAIVCMNMTVNIPPGHSGLRQSQGLMAYNCYLISCDNEFILEGR
jgi:hypothetical protein